MDKTFDVGVVGGGMVALNIALSLVKKDSKLKIAIFRPAKQPGAGSLAAGAMLGCFSEVTSRTFQNQYGQSKFKISLQALQRWSDLIDEVERTATVLPNKSILTTEGTCVIQNTDSGKLDDANFDAIVKALDEYQIPYEQIQPDAIQGYQPIDSSRSLKALFISDESGMDPNVAIQKLEDTLDKIGNITFFNKCVTALLHNGQQVRGVACDDSQEYACSETILANGSFAQALIDQTPLKYRIPRLYFGMGNAYVAQMVNYPKPLPRQIIRTPNRSFACGLHVVPRPNDEIYVGATNNVIPNCHINARVDLIHFITGCVIKQINKDFHFAEFKQLLCGNRPVSLDTYPIIGRTSMTGLTVASGTYRDGLEQSTFIGEYISDIILGRSLSDPVYESFQHFIPERYPINNYDSKEQAIQEAIDHYVAGIYEHNITMPLVGWTDLYDSLLYSNIKQLYDLFEEDTILSPDFILMIDTTFDAEKKEMYKKCIKEHFHHAKLE